VVGVCEVGFWSAVHLDFEGLEVRRGHTEEQRSSRELRITLNPN